MLVITDTTSTTATTTAATAVPKIHYFPLSGRGEFVKILFEDAKKPYEFVPHALGAHKTIAGLPYGQLPYFVDCNGFELAQTGTIVRYVAKKLNQYPSNPRDAAKAEEVADQVFDIAGKYFTHLFGGLAEADFKTYLTTQWAQFEAVLGKSESKGEYVTSSFTFADLALFHIVHTLKSFTPPTGALAAHHAKIAARPNVAAWLSSSRYLPPGLPKPPAKTT